jgi:hypothetical protein
LSKIALNAGIASRQTMGACRVPVSPKGELLLNQELLAPMLIGPEAEKA